MSLRHRSAILHKVPLLGCSFLTPCSDPKDSLVGDFIVSSPVDMVFPYICRFHGRCAIDGVFSHSIHVG